MSTNVSPSSSIVKTAMGDVEPAAATVTTRARKTTSASVEEPSADAEGLSTYASAQTAYPNGQSNGSAMTSPTSSKLRADSITSSSKDMSPSKVAALPPPRRRPEPSFISSRAFAPLATTGKEGDDAGNVDNAQAQSSKEGGMKRAERKSKVSIKCYCSIYCHQAEPEMETIQSANL